MNYELLKKAVKTNNTDSLDIEALKPEKNEYFIDAAKYGHLDVLKYLISLTLKEERPNMIHAGNNDAFILAAERGRLDVLKYLILLTPEIERPNMIHAQDNDAFMWAVSYGRLDVVKYLSSLIPEVDKHKIIHAKDNYAFSIASAGGHLDVLKYLISLTPKEERPDMIHAKGNDAFILASANGCLDVLKYLVSITEFANLPSLPINNNNTTSYLENLNSFITSVKTNDLAKLNELFGITITEGIIVEINEEKDITLNLVNKAIQYCQTENNLEQSLALLTKISKHVMRQHERMIIYLNEHFPRDLSNLIEEYVSPPPIMQEEAPTPSVSMMQLDTRRNR